MVNDKNKVEYLNGYFDAFNNLKIEKNRIEAKYFNGRIDNIVKILELKGDLVSEIYTKENVSYRYLEEWLTENIATNLSCQCDNKLINHIIFKVLDYIDIVIFDNNHIDSILEYKFYYEYYDSIIKRKYKMTILQLSFKNEHLLLCNDIPQVEAVV